MSSDWRSLDLLLEVVFIPNSVMPSPTQNQINPKKLRLSKWTAVNPQEKEKHFLVTKVVDPEQAAKKRIQALARILL